MSAATENLVLPPAAEGMEDGSIDLLAIAVAIISEWRIGVIVFLIVTAISVAYVYTLKPQYVATATFLPQEGHTGGETLASLFSNRGPGALYIGLLHSRSVQDNTIDRLNLLQQFRTQDREVARNILASKSTFVEGSDSLITISIRDGDAHMAASIADAYMQGLEDLNDKMAADQSTLTRRFFEHQLQQERDALATAEMQLQELQKRTGLIRPETQASTAIANVAGLRAQIDSLRVQLAGLLSGETEQNPRVQVVRNQLAALEAQERNAETGSGAAPVGAAPSAVQIPQGTLDLARAQREVAYHEGLVSSLANQYETARLNEASARSVFQVVDKAIVPETKAWPPRKSYLEVCFLLGILIGMISIVVSLVSRRIAANANHRQQLIALRRAFSSR